MTGAAKGARRSEARANTLGADAGRRRRLRVSVQEPGRADGADAADGAGAWADRRLSPGDAGGDGGAERVPEWAGARSVRSIYICRPVCKKHENIHAQY